MENFLSYGVSGRGGGGGGVCDGGGKFPSLFIVIKFILRITKTQRFCLLIGLTTTDSVAQAI